MDKFYSRVRLYTLLVLFIVPFYGNSQVNEYFLNNPVWKVSSSCQVGLPCVRYDEYNYYVNGDTLINGFTYVKVFKKGTYNFNWFSSPPAPPTCVGYFSYINIVPDFYLRSDNKEMYILFDGNPSETLLYDFDLSVGDTLPVTYNSLSNNVVVTGIDSLYTPYGYRKRFAISGPNTWSTELLEGIGHNLGLIETMDGVLECGWNLECYSLNDTAWYPATGPTCNMNVGLVENIVLNPVKVFPNPMNDRTVFTWNTNWNDVSLTVFNSAGIVVEEVSVINNGNYELLRGSLMQSVYFYQLQNSIGILGRGKLVVIN